MREKAVIRQGASYVYVAVNFYFSIVFGYGNVCSELC